jgi:LuxR family maltose regulon positive regulatory protein
VRAETAAVDAATPSGDPLMSAKLRVAEIRSRVVVRQRLLDRLRHGARGPLTLVSAPAGSGKTVLASSWVSA